jgi:UDP-N-acetyl-2-amino-2-deoxyglucuronate dehydrogenase
VLFRSAICEKPIVLNPWNLDALEEIEGETGNRVYGIMQLRHHPSIIRLKEKMQSEGTERKHDVELTYITCRGKWYLVSWKGDVSKSGGIATNIGIHFFDMLQWIFGPVEWNRVHLDQPDKASGYLELKGARVRWFLSLDRNDLPASARLANHSTYRSITVDGEEGEFSEGFTDLHTISYQEILTGRGFRLDEVRPSIQTVYEIRNAKEMRRKGDYHPFLNASVR